MQAVISWSIDEAVPASQSPPAHATGIARATLTGVFGATPTFGVIDDGQKYQDQAKGQRDLVTQITVSVTLGLFAFFTFCIMRLKWSSLYSARRKVRASAAVLPELDKSLFGWIPVVYKIDGDQVLASAGLDAYVFLRFYEYAQRLLTIIFLFAVTIILPITYSYTGRYGYPWDGKPTDPDDDDGDDTSTYLQNSIGPPSAGGAKADANYLWIYVIFAYVFTGIAVQMLMRYTVDIIHKRQSYLGSQTTTTDRTFRLTGIPPEMRTVELIQNFIEELGIGKVQKVNICRDWSELDNLLARRIQCRDRLEKLWAQYLGYKARDAPKYVVASDAVDDGGELGTLADEDEARPLLDSGESASNQIHGPHADAHNDSAVGSGNGSDSDEAEAAPLLGRHERLSSVTGASDIVSQHSGRARPQKRLWYGSGIFKFRCHKVDAISYYQNELTDLDEQIERARQQEYPPMSLAFVTMESTASCQMAMQAILDPSPLRLKARIAPAPADVVWRNTYLSRVERKLRSWSITTLILVLSLFWSALLVPLAYLLNLETIEKVVPQLAAFLADHAVLKSLVQTGLPTLTLSLMSIGVPYLYDWLANLQGMTSQGDIELSVISKNFFFSFFNLFLVFTVFATASNFYGLWENLRDVFKDTTIVAFALARSLERLAPFYTNLIVLQGLGLHPFRLLEFGAVFLYPFQRLGAYTPRDYVQLTKPPTFSYGMALPQAILIFVICIVYSVFPSSWLVALFGVLYFAIGGFIYKYQLLYAMDHSQHSTGRAWPMVGSRIIMGLIMFQLTTIGSLALRTAITRSILIVPLLFATVWFWYFFARTYDPLMKFIALRSIDRSRQPVRDDLSAGSSASDRQPASDGPRNAEEGHLTVPAIAAAASASSSPAAAAAAAAAGTSSLPRMSPTPGALSPPRRTATFSPSGLERDTVPMRLGGRDYGPALTKYVNPNLSVHLDQPWISGKSNSWIDQFWATSHSESNVARRNASRRRGSGTVTGASGNGGPAGCPRRSLWGEALQMIPRD
ncbi:hypothetical protein KEM52_004274 [Ascosphaera acerosa]|nr:hypothetical protein KEM52_004274 [Ascosphaera acerosa]